MQLKYYWKKKTILSYIAIIFVVIIHNSATQQYSIPSDSLTNLTTFIHNTFAYAIGAIAIPIFFFISGLSMFRNYHTSLYFKKLKSRIKTLLIPYLIWNIIGLLFCIFCTYTPISNFISSREMFEPTFQNILEGIFLYKYNFQFWFLFDLIIFVIFTPIINLIIARKWTGLIFGLITLLLPLFTDSLLGLNPYFIVFYYLGCYLGKHHLKTFTLPASQKISLISGFTFVVFIIIKILSLYNIIQLPTLSSQIILLIMLISAWFFSDLFITKIKKFTFTYETFPIYALHTYFLAIIIKLIYLLAPHTSWMLLINEISSTFLTIVIVTFLSKLWHQKLPKSYQIMFGHK